MLKEFREFAMKGNALDLAIGVIIGAAFSTIINSLVQDIIMPIIGIFGKADFSNYFIPLSHAVTATNLVDAKKQGGVLAYGNFITNVINFLIVASALFFIIKLINSMHKKNDAPAAPPPPTRTETLLAEIRDAVASPGYARAVRGDSSAS
jgi:large conductance mechanosensitive channel